MARYSMLVYSNPVEGKEEEYMKWYREVHIPDMCRIPGVVRCTLYKVSDNQYGLTQEKYPYSYVNNMEMETDDFMGLLMEMGKRRMSGENVWSDAIDEGPCVIVEPVIG